MNFLLTDKRKLIATLAVLLVAGRADKALYEAKKAGRNCVRVAA